MTKTFNTSITEKDYEILGKNVSLKTMGYKRTVRDVWWEEGVEDRQDHINNS